MKSLRLLMAAMPTITTFALYISETQPLENHLIIRSPVRGNSNQGPNGERVVKVDMPGSADVGIKRPNAPTNQHEQVQEMVDESKGVVRTKPYTEGNYPILKGREPSPGKSSMVYDPDNQFCEPGENGKGATINYRGNEEGPHLQRLLDKERKYPKSRETRYSPRDASPNDRNKISNAGTGDTELGRQSKDKYKEKTVNDELRQNTQTHAVGHPASEVPTDVYKADERSSVLGDAQSARRLKEHARATNTDIIHRSNPSVGRRDTKVLPVKQRYDPNDPNDVMPDVETFAEGAPRDYIDRRIKDSGIKLKERPKSKSPKGSSSRGNGRNKRDLLGATADEISQQDAPNAHPTGSTPNFRDEYEQYINAYNTLQNNATMIVVPIIEEMLDGHNSSLIWGAAWDILSLADPSLSVMGPFWQGTHSMYYLEDQVRNSTDPETMAYIELISDVAIDIYMTYWDMAYTALNSSLLLDDLETVSELLYTNDTSVADLTPDTSSSDAVSGFFADFLNSTTRATSKGAVLANDASNKTGLRLPVVMNGTNATRDWNLVSHALAADLKNISNSAPIGSE